MLALETGSLLVVSIRSDSPPTGGFLREFFLGARQYSFLGSGTSESIADRISSSPQARHVS